MKKHRKLLILNLLAASSIIVLLLIAYLLFPSGEDAAGLALWPLATIVAILVLVAFVADLIVLTKRFIPQQLKKHVVWLVPLLLIMAYIIFAIYITIRDSAKDNIY